MNFTVSSGWLRYHPNSTYKLPRIVRVEEKDEEGRWRNVSATFTRRGGESWEVPLYLLEWPGFQEKGGDDEIPTEICYNWPGVQKYENDRNQGGSHMSLRTLLENHLVPDEPPETVAYHLAVNQHIYGDAKFPVAGLPVRRVNQVLNARFAINERYYAALQYLMWHAEGHRHHPLFSGAFDTVVREKLVNLSHESVRLFFYMLGDCQYDPESEWYSRGDCKHWWDNLATYFHFVGRTGTGLYRGLAFPQEYRMEKVEEEMPDLMDRLKAWNGNAMRQAREAAHTTGKDPCVVAEKNLAEEIGILLASDEPTVEGNVVT